MILGFLSLSSFSFPCCFPSFVSPLGVLLMFSCILNDSTHHPFSCPLLSFFFPLFCHHFYSLCLAFWCVHCLYPSFFHLSSPVLSHGTQKQLMPMKMLVIVKWKCKVESQWFIRKEFCQWNKCSLDPENPAAVNDFTRLLSFSHSLSLSIFLFLSHSLSAFSFKVLSNNDCLTNHIAKASIQMKNSDEKCKKKHTK